MHQLNTRGHILELLRSHSVNTVLDVGNQCDVTEHVVYHVTLQTGQAVKIRILDFEGKVHGFCFVFPGVT